MGVHRPLRADQTWGFDRGTQSPQADPPGDVGRLHDDADASVSR